MWEAILQDSRAAGGEVPGPGAGRYVPELWIFGILRTVVECQITVERPADQITDREAKKLIKAVLARAIRDSRLRGYEAQDARAWLASGEAAAWLVLLGNRIKQDDITAWLQGPEMMQNDAF